MTQPVQEPTQGREDSGQGYRTRQLFRRPPLVSSVLSGIFFEIANVGHLLSIYGDDHTKIEVEDPVSESPHRGDAYVLVEPGAVSLWAARQGVGGIAEVVVSSSAHPVVAINAQEIVSDTNEVNIHNSLASGCLIRLNTSGTGGAVQVYSGTTLMFEVRDDGSVHGLASVGAITWDL